VILALAPLSAQSWADQLAAVSYAFGDDAEGNIGLADRFNPRAAAGALSRRSELRRENARDGRPWRRRDGIVAAYAYKGTEN